jgi:hypothetical protein
MEEQKKTEEVKNEVKVEEKTSSENVIISKKKILIIGGAVLLVFFVFLISVAIFLSNTLHSARGKAREKSYENKKMMEMKMNNVDNFSGLEGCNCNCKRSR